jgi:hypothetical protein
MHGENASVLPFGMPQESQAVNNRHVLKKSHASFAWQDYLSTEGHDFSIDGLLMGGSLDELLKRMRPPT